MTKMVWPLELGVHIVCVRLPMCAYMCDHVRLHVGFEILTKTYDCSIFVGSPTGLGNCLYVLTWAHGCVINVRLLAAHFGWQFCGNLTLSQSQFLLLLSSFAGFSSLSSRPQEESGPLVLPLPSAGLFLSFVCWPIGSIMEPMCSLNLGSLPFSEQSSETFGLLKEDLRFLRFPLWTSSINKVRARELASDASHVRLL